MIIEGESLSLFFSRKKINIEECHFYEGAGLFTLQDGGIRKGTSEEFEGEICKCRPHPQLQLPALSTIGALLAGNLFSSFRNHRGCERGARRRSP